MLLVDVCWRQSISWAFSQDPYKYCDTLRAKEVLYTEDHRAAAREIAAETFVLLKNTGNLLPLERKGRIAL